MAETTNTHLRIPNAINDRLKAVLGAAENGMSVTKLAENLLSECLAAIESDEPPAEVSPTITLLRKQAGKRLAGGASMTMSMNYDSEMSMALRSIVAEKINDLMPEVVKEIVQNAMDASRNPAGSYETKAELRQRSPASRKKAA